MDETINPKKLYSFTEAAAHIPSCRRGKRLAVRTLHRWRREGKLKVVARESFSTTHYFVPGAEIIRLSEAAPDGPAPRVRTPSARRLAVADAERRARLMGLI